MSPMYDMNNIRVYTDLNLGIMLHRDVAGITTGQNPIYTIFTGPVLVRALYGVVTVQLQAAALLIHLDFNADSGAGQDFDLCVDSADLTGTAVGTVLIPPATVAGAITTDGGGGLNICPSWVMMPGTLDLHANNTRTGTILWTMFYVPLIEGAYVTAHA